MSAALYDRAVAYSVAIYFDDGDDPIAGGGPSADFADLDEARRWGQEQADAAQRDDPAPAEAPGWSAVIERGHYEKTGTTGFDEIDFDWHADADFSEVLPAEVAA